MADAFTDELPRLVELPGDDFSVEERVTVTSGKTPYVRFDRNDYSVPHTHVCRSLVVLATDDRVRVVDPEAPMAVLADHRRSFDRDHRIEHEPHVRALVEEERRAHQSRGFDRLFSAAPSTHLMIEKLAERGATLGAAAVQGGPSFVSSIPASAVFGSSDGFVVVGRTSCLPHRRGATG